MDLSEYAQTFLQDPEESREGNMNEVAVGKHRVAREYNNPPLVQRLYSKLVDEDYGQLRDERITNAEEAYENRDELGFRIPERIHSEGVVEEVEKVQGPNMYDYVLEKSEKEVIKAVSEFATALKETHENGFAIRDCRLENFVYEDCQYSGETYVSIIDTEWVEQDPSEIHVEDDLRSLAVNVTQLPENVRDKVTKVFEETYGDELDDYVDLRAKRDMVIESARDSIARRDVDRFTNTVDYMFSP